MNLICSSCGAAAPEGTNRLASSWGCGFCSGTNYNEDYVKAYLDSVDLSKFSNQMRLGKAAFDAQNFRESADKFDLALSEDAGSFEAWAYKGLSLAHLIDLSNIASLPAQVNSCFSQARGLAPEDEFVTAAGHVGRQLVVGELLRLAGRSKDEGLKVLFAFSHEPTMARMKASKHFSVAQNSCRLCLQEPSHSVQQMLDVCRLGRQIASADGAPSDPELAAAIDSYLAWVRESHPLIEIPEVQVTRRKSASCFPGSSQVMTPTGARPIAVLQAGDLVLVPVRSGEGVGLHRTVRRKLELGPSKIIELCFLDGASVRATSHHTFQTDRGWRKVSQLGPGDMLVGAEGQLRELCRVRWTGVCEPVFNLHVNGDGTYVVDGLIVHSFTVFRAVRVLLGRLAALESGWALLGKPDRRLVE